MMKLDGTKTCLHDVHLENVLNVMDNDKDLSLFLVSIRLCVYVHVCDMS